MGKGRGKGGRDSGPSPSPSPPIAEAEFRKHAGGGPGKDAWLVVDGQVFDVSSFQHRHPGGAELFRAWAGRDASAPFHAFHPDPSIPRKYLPSLLKGPAAAPAHDVHPTPEQDLEKVREHAREQGWFEPSVFFYTWNIASVVVLEAVAWCVLADVGTGWGPFALACLLLATAQAQAGWLQHDFGHSSVFATRRANKLMHCLIIGHFKGASSSWWNYRHFKHHSQPNIVKEDPDVNVPYLFLLGDVIPEKWAEKKAGVHSLYHYQHLYWWMLGPPLLLPTYFIFDNLTHLWRTRDLYDFAWLMSFFVRWHFQFSPLLGGLSGMFGLYFSMRFVESHWFTWVTQMNHIPMDIDFHKGATKDSKDWIRLQLESTLNVHPGAFNDWFTGHLNYQIEHHLMPTMPRHHYPKVKPLIEDLCRKHSIVYRSKTLLGAMGDIVASMKASGQLWLEAYHLDD
jgi:fatty acid desaturase